MQVTFNPGLTSSRMSNKNCCGGGKKVAFGKDLFDPEYVAGSTGRLIVLIGQFNRNPELATPANKALLEKTRRIAGDIDISGKIEYFLQNRWQELIQRAGNA